MTWARMDDGLPEHPKSDALEVAAGGWQVYAVACMTWRDMCCDCSRRLTDGAFTRQRAHRVLRAPSKIIDKALVALLSAGFLDAGDGPDAFQFHDWSTYNPTRAKVEADRELKTKRQQKWRGGASHDDDGDARVDAPTQPSRDASTAPSVELLPRARVPVPTHPIPAQPKEETPERAGEAVPAPRPSPRAKPLDSAETPPVDPAARAVFDAIVGDPMLAPITRKPADLATRLTAPGAFPGVNVLGQVLRAAAWNAGQRKPKRDGRAFLLGWLGRSDPEAPSPLQSGVYEVPEDPTDPWVIGLARLAAETRHAG